ncbi:MAG: hypothetical protein OXH60_11875 [Rhodospirillales bacterium]|nr:hypothetical protein [Rhodospirillales bacterium]
MSVFRLGLCEGGGRPRAPPVAAALRTFGFGAAPPGAGLARALLALSVLLVTATAADAQTTLVSNAGENRDNFVVAGDSASGRITQGFTTGSNTAGYDLSSVGIHIHGDTSSSTETITVSVHRFDSSETNNLGDLVATLSTPSPLNEGAVNDFTAPSNTRLLPNTGYLVNIVSVGNSPYDFQIGATLSGAETGAEGWLIENAFRLNGSLNFPSYSIMMNVKGSNRIPPLIPTLESAEALFVNGALRYRFDLKLSEGVRIPYREMRDHAFSVTNGRMDGAVRIHKERTGGNLYSNHWRMRVAPVDETKPVTVTLRGNRPCNEQGALCTGSGGRLDGSPALTLSTDSNPPDLGSLPSLSIADTSGTEDSANLAFDVSLSKAVSATIAVDFRTVSGGTATANADYREASYRILFSAGETVRPGSVALMEDAAADDGETVNVEIANARVITPRGVEFGPLSITTGQATGTIDAPASSTTPLPDVDMRIENTRGSERGGWLHFTVKLSRALDEYVCYDFETLDTGSATEGVDYLQRPKSTLWQPPGVTEWTEFVRILDDSIDDGGETVRVRISDAELCDDASRTITINRGEATGTIVNDDPMPAAWLARFGRTVADQVIGAVAGRMEAARAPGMELTLAGQRVGASGALEERETEAGLETLAEWLRGADEETEASALTSRAVSGRELLSSFSFALTEGTAESGFGALWGGGALTRFDGREGDLTLEGEVASAMLGADVTRGRGTAGLVVAHSLGEGDYRSPAGGGAVETTLTGLYPWGRYAASERLSLWGIAGYGAGTLTLTPADQAPIETDMDLMMAALGGRGVVAKAPAEGGLELSVTSDALVVRTTSDEVRGSGGSLASSEADVTRLRLGLEGTWRGLGTLVPTLEVGVRHDGGDAETGFGADIGARLLWADPSLGMRAEVAARGLLTHEDGGLSERGFAGSLAWDPSPDSDRGLELTLRQAVGSEATGGMDALLRPETARALAAAHDDGSDRRRLEARVGYGVALFGGSWTGVPEFGLGLTETGREYIHAWRLQEARDAGLVFGLDVEGVRNEKPDGNAAPEHRFGLGLGWEVVGARRENLALRLEVSRLLPANDNPESRIGVRATARW